jgi:hypothetical protein
MWILFQDKHNSGWYVGAAVVYDAWEEKVRHVLQAGMIL